MGRCSFLAAFICVQYKKNRRSSLVLVLFSPLPQLGIQIFWTVRQAVMAGVCFCPGIGLSGCALRNDTEIEERAFLALQLAKVPVSYLKRISLKFSVVVEIHRSLHGANNSPQSMVFFDGKIGCVLVEFAFVVVCGAWAECSRPGKL